MSSSPAPASPSRRTVRASASSAPARSRPADSAWEDRLIGAVDRFLSSTMGPSSAAAEGDPKRPDGKRPDKKRGRLGDGLTWKRATAAEGIGVVVVLLFVLIARPGGGDAATAAAAGEPDLFEAVAEGADAEGAVLLASGARVHLLGVSLPTAEDPPAVRAAALRGLNRIMRGRRVRVEFDPILPSAMQEGLPQMAAYVWVLDAEGRRKGMANAMLISRGLARPVTSLRYRHQNAFVEAAYLAQSRRQGVWQAPPQGSVAVF